MATELDAILGYIEELKALDTTGVEPMTHAVPFACPYRADEVAGTLPVEAALQNAPAARGELLPGPPHRPWSRRRGGGEG